MNHLYRIAARHGEVLDPGMTTTKSDGRRGPGRRGKPPGSRSQKPVTENRDPGELSKATEAKMKALGVRGRTINHVWQVAKAPNSGCSTDRKHRRRGAKWTISAGGRDLPIFGPSNRPLDDAMMRRALHIIELGKHAAMAAAQKSSSPRSRKAMAVDHPLRREEIPA